MICKRCKEEKPEEQFSHGWRAGERDSTCKRCRYAQHKLRQAAQWNAFFAARSERKAKAAKA